MDNFVIYLINHYSVTKFNNPQSARATPKEDEVEIGEELIETLSDNPFENFPDDFQAEKNESLEDDDFNLSYSKSFPNISKYQPKEENKQFDEKEQMKRLSEHESEESYEEEEEESESEIDEENHKDNTYSSPSFWKSQSRIPINTEDKSLCQTAFEKASSAMTNRKKWEERKEI